MTQKKYTDVTRLGHKTTVDVLKKGDFIVIQEKIDGANASFTLEDSTLVSFSRNTKLEEGNTLGGFYNFVNESIGAKQDLLNPNYIYFGEWTNPHKVKYEGYEKQFFLFDIYDKAKEEYLDFSEVKYESEKLGLNLIPVFYEGKYQSFEHLESFVGKTAINGKLGEKQLGEGIVVKNVNYRDRFGVQKFVKLVVDEFREVQKQKKAKNPTAYLNTPEYLLAESVTTYPRVEKIIYKLIDENVIPKEIENQHIGIIFKEVNVRTYEDVIKEESDSVTEDLDITVLRKHISSLGKNHARTYLMNAGVL